MTGIPLLIKPNANVPRKFELKTKVCYEGYVNNLVMKTALEEFKRNIETTYTEYVYPAVFTNASGVRFIPEENLYKLRLWANIYRDTYKDNSEEYNNYYIYRLFLKIFDE